MAFYSNYLYCLTIDLKQFKTFNFIYLCRLHCICLITFAYYEHLNQILIMLSDTK